MNIEKEARDKVEAARAALEDALDELDGVKGDGVNMDALRSRIGAEIGRGKARLIADPLKGIGIAIGCTAVVVWFLTRTFGC